MEQLLENQKLPKLSQNERDSMNSPVDIEEIKCIIKNYRKRNL